MAIYIIQFYLIKYTKTENKTKMQCKKHTHLIVIKVHKWFVLWLRHLPFILDSTMYKECFRQKLTFTFMLIKDIEATFSQYLYIMMLWIKLPPGLWSECYLVIHWKPKDPWKALSLHFHPGEVVVALIYSTNPFLLYWVICRCNKYVFRV